VAFGMTMTFSKHLRGTILFFFSRCCLLVQQFLSVMMKPNSHVKFYPTFHFLRKLDVPTAGGSRSAETIQGKV
jgi:hypothetical protein